MVSSYSLPFSWLNHRTTLYTGYSDNYVVELSECTLHLVYLYHVQNSAFYFTIKRETSKSYFLILHIQENTELSDYLLD